MDGQEAKALMGRTAFLQQQIAEMRAREKVYLEEAMVLMDEGLEKARQAVEMRESANVCRQVLTLAEAEMQEILDRVDKRFRRMKRRRGFSVSASGDHWSFHS